MFFIFFLKRLIFFLQCSFFYNINEDGNFDKNINNIKFGFDQVMLNKSSEKDIIFLFGLPAVSHYINKNQNYLLFIYKKIDNLCIEDIAIQSYFIFILEKQSESFVVSFKGQFNTIFNNELEVNNELVSINKDINHNKTTANIETVQYPVAFFSYKYLSEYIFLNKKLKKQDSLTEFCNVFLFFKDINQGFKKIVIFHNKLFIDLLEKDSTLKDQIINLKNIYKKHGSLCKINKELLKKTVIDVFQLKDITKNNQCNKIYIYFDTKKHNNEYCKREGFLSIIITNQYNNIIDFFFFDNCCD
jgi:hypothetical protein